MRPSSYTCPKCGRTSHNPADAEHHWCGFCNRFRADLGLRFRVYVEGRVAAEAWVDLGGAVSSANLDRYLEASREVSREHLAVAVAAHEERKRWLVECWNPDAPEGEAYLRFGTDAGGMVAPMQIPSRWLGWMN